MRYVCIIFCLLVANLHAFAQKSLFKGDWNYFNKDGIYCEVTITDHYIYYYSDSGDAERTPVRWMGNSLAFGKET